MIKERLRKFDKAFEKWERKFVFRLAGLPIKQRLLSLTFTFILIGAITNFSPSVGIGFSAFTAFMVTYWLWRFRVYEKERRDSAKANSI